MGQPSLHLAQGPCNGRGAARPAAMNRPPCGEIVCLHPAVAQDQPRNRAPCIGTADGQPLGSKVVDFEGQLESRPKRWLLRGRAGWLHQLRRQAPAAVDGDGLWVKQGRWPGRPLRPPPQRPLPAKPHECQANRGRRRHQANLPKSSDPMATNTNLNTSGEIRSHPPI